MKKTNKKDLIELICIILTTLLLCSNFLQMHFSSDTYVLIDLGYFDYPSAYFLRDGRLFSTLACYLGGILHLPYSIYIVAMDFIGMIFLSLSIYTISKLFRKILCPKTIWYEILLIIASHFLILNQFSLEYLLFPESAIMCMGVFFLSLGAKTVFEKPKHCYLKVFVFLFLTSISYQAELNIFPLLVALIYILKQVKEPKPIKTFLKEFFKEMLIISGILLLIITFSAILVSICKYIFEDKKNHFVKIVSQRTFWLRFKSIKNIAKEVWVYGIHMMPKNFLTTTIIITLVLLIANRAKIQTYFYYIFLCILAFSSCILPLFVCNSGACGRVNVPTMMILAISSLILISTNLSKQIENEQLNSFKKYRIYIAPVFTITLFLINGIFIVQNTSEHIAANKVDDNTGATINALIKKYEEENNITVTNFAYTYDQNGQQFSVGIKPMQSMTERKFACRWSILSAMNYYCNRKFKIVSFKWPEEEQHSIYSIDSIYNQNRNDYICFSEEQIFFKDDTVYMLVY